MIPAALSNPKLTKPKPRRFTVTLEDSETGKRYDVEVETDGKDLSQSDLAGVQSQFESQLRKGQAISNEGAAVRDARSYAGMPATKRPDPVALYKQSIGQVPPSSVMTGAAAGMGGGTRQPKRMDLSVLAGGVPTSGVMGPAPIQSRTPNEAKATENIKWSNDLQAKTRAAIEDNPVSTFLAGLDPTDVLIPAWKKGLAGHILGAVSGVANIPANVAGNVQMVYDPNATPEQQLKALGSVGFDLAGGALIGPAGKLVKKGALMGAGATKAGRAIAVNAAMKETAKSGIKAGQAISALVKAGVPKAEAVQAVKAAEFERVNNPPMSVKTGGIEEVGNINHGEPARVQVPVPSERGVDSGRMGQGGDFTSQGDLPLESRSVSPSGNGKGSQGAGVTSEPKVTQPNTKWYEAMTAAERRANQGVYGGQNTVGGGDVERMWDVQAGYDFERAMRSGATVVEATEQTRRASREYVQSHNQRYIGSGAGSPRRSEDAADKFADKWARIWKEAHSEPIPARERTFGTEPAPSMEFNTPTVSAYVIENGEKRILGNYADANSARQAIQMERQPYEITQANLDYKSSKAYSKQAKTATGRKSPKKQFYVPGDSTAYPTFKDAQIAEHRAVISQAIKEGKPVPAEVLADYPDLVAQYKVAPVAPTPQAPKLTIPVPKYNPADMAPKRFPDHILQPQEKVTPPVTSPPDNSPVKEHTYRLTQRPASDSTTPDIPGKQIIPGSMALDGDNLMDYGKATFPRPLSADEMNAFDLVPDIDGVPTHIIRRLSGGVYNVGPENYARMASREWDSNVVTELKTKLSEFDRLTELYVTGKATPSEMAERKKLWEYFDGGNSKYISQLRKAVEVADADARMAGKTVRQRGENSGGVARGQDQSGVLDAQRGGNPGDTASVTPPVKEPFTTPVETPKGRVKGTPKSNTQLASAIRELDPFDDTGYELLDAAHRRLKGSPLPKIDDPSEFARLRDSLADEIDADSLKLEGQRMDVDARKQAGKEAAEYFKGEKWGTVKDAPDPFVTVRQNKSGAYVEGRAVPMVSLERFTGGGEHIAADIVSAFDTRGWGDDVAVLPRSVLKERQYGRGENRATGIRLSEMGTRYTPDQIRNGEAKLEEVYIPQGWMKEYVRNARFRANELEYPKETLIYDDPGVISAARKDVAEVRDILGIDPYQKTVVTDKELMAAAKEHNAYEVMSDVQAGKTASASEQQSMAVEFQRLRNEMRAAKEADEIDKYRDLWEKAGSLADALDKVGSEAGRTMRARRLIVDDAFDTFGLTRAIENAQDGKPLTAKQQVNVENLVNDAARIRKELAKAQKELDDIRAGGEIQARAKRAPRFSRQELDDELESLLTQFKAGVSKASSGIDPELIPIVGKIALNYAKRGINTIDEIVEAIQGHIPNISRQEVIDAIAMPGEPRTKSELAKSLSELRTEAKRLSTPTQAKKATAAENMAAKKAETQRLAGIKRDRIEAERLEKAGRRAEAKALRDDIAARAKGEKKAQRADEALERGNAADLKRKADRVRDVQKKIAEYERRIREGDFVTPTKEEVVKTNQLRQLEGEMDYRRKQFESMRKMAASETSKSMTVAKELSGIVRYSTLSADLGQLLRQGRYAIVHGKSYAKGLTAAVQSIGSEKNFRAIMHELDNKRIGGQFMPSVRKKAGLSLTDSVNDFEEGFVSKIMQKVPIVGKPLERFQSAFMNTVRADMFDTFATRFDDLSEAELKARAQLINSLTGRSNLKSVPDALGVIMTSPRWTASRYELLFRPVKDVKLALQGNRGAKENLKTWAAGAATYIAPLIIADRVLKAQNPDWGVQWNDESGDAWKVRVGDHVYDIGGSVSIPLRTVSRMVKGLYEGDLGFSAREAGKTAMGTMNPGVRVPLEMTAGSDFMGFPDDEKDAQGWMKLAPLLAQNVYKNITTEQGAAFTAADALSEFIGLGANTYPKSKNPVKPIPRGTLTKEGKPKKTKVFGF